ncbi:MAG: ferrous iron transport protein A [Bacteroidales bacterium]|nr:ferrous iron transport protein A [Bacteroidales bacterium]MCF8333313.1 ferrous iron transport protein A [Bacteroidales bacterium]
MFKKADLYQIQKEDYQEIALNKLAKGDSGVVKRLAVNDNSHLHKFLAMGIVPGRVIQLMRTSPVFILQIDNTQAAMDKELAEQIIMKVL